MAHATESDRVDVIAVGLVERHPVTGMPTRDNRFRYDGMVYMPGQRARVPKREARRFVRSKQVQVVNDLPSVRWWDAPGRILQCEPGPARVLSSTPTPGALRIVQGTGYDPGNAGYRFHTAVNEYTPHASAFVRYINRQNNPFDCPWQYNATTDLPAVRALLLDADVVHCHMDARLTQNAGMPRRPRVGQVIVRHYHGTQFVGDRPAPDADQMPVLSATQDDMDGYVLVGARLQVCALRPGRIQWLPIAVPVNRYAMMAGVQRPTHGGPFRIAHSPTVSAIKGTDAFTAACQRLRRRGVAVEPVMIRKQSHARALALRATCDATFDSFALGIQGSGLEAAAMLQPVIAGDAGVADLYRQHVGEVPYTFADDAVSLESAIERLSTDPDYYRGEADRVHAYCRRYHDYPAVAARYDAILTAAGARRLD